MASIVEKIKKASLSGRGGGCFSTAQKWEMVKTAKGKTKYVIANGSEGEPGIKKDYYVLENHAEEMISGMMLAVDYLRAEKGYVYLNEQYFRKFEKKLKKIIKGLPLKIFCKAHQAGYIGGEETAVLNCIEGRRVEPRLRPPYPTTNGLFDCPTLINNLETFYDVSLIAAGKYEGKRLYTINGDCLWTGVYCLPEDWTIEKLLRETKNYPDFDFFVQVGGDASGTVFNSAQLKRPAGGCASITVYSLIKHDLTDLMKNWIDFFACESCGQCTPCREGVYRLREILNSKEPDWKLFSEVLNTLSETSFCGLGCAVPIPFESFVSNVLMKNRDNKIKFPPGAQKMICECF